MNISADLEVLLKNLDWEKYAVRPYSFFFWSFILKSYHSYENWLGTKFDYLMVFDAAFEKIYYRDSSKTKEMEKFILDKQNNISFWEEHVVRGNKELDRVSAEFDLLAEEDLSKKSDSELLHSLRQLCEDKADFIGLLSSLNLVVPILTNKLQKEAVEPALAKQGREKELNQILGLFSQSLGLSVYIREETELLDLATKKDSPGFEQAFAAHLKKWEKMAFGSGHKLLTREQFLARISEVKDPAEQLSILKKKSIQTEEEILAAEKSLGFSDCAKRILKIVRMLLFQKTREDFMMSVLEYILLSYFREISRRKNIPFDLAKMLTMDEAIAMFAGKKISETELAERKKAALIIQFKNQQSVIAGKEAEAMHKRIIKEVAPKKFSGTLKGMTGCKGYVKGKVRLIQHISHLDQLLNGEILVTAATNPAFVIAMKRSAAIVTDEGGITSHAAIVSREFGIPSVVGTKFATQWLKTGDVVEVNADKGIVKLLKSFQ